MGQQLDAKQQSKLEALLAEKIKQGEIVVSNFAPSLNKALIAKGPGAVFAGEVEGVHVNAMPNRLNKGTFSDIVDLVDANGEAFSFFAPNEGTKGKVKNLENGNWAVIIYVGEKASKNKSFNDYRDFNIYRFEGATAKASALKIAGEISAVLK